MNTRIIYLSPNYEGSISEFEALSNDEKVCEAKNCPNDDIQLFGLEEFADAFNGERISDLGFIYVVTI